MTFLVRDLAVHKTSLQSGSGKQLWNGSYTGSIEGLEFLLEKIDTEEIIRYKVKLLDDIVSFKAKYEKFSENSICVSLEDHPDATTALAPSLILVCDSSESYNRWYDLLSTDIVGNSNNSDMLITDIIRCGTLRFSETQIKLKRSQRRLVTLLSDHTLIIEKIKPFASMRLNTDTKIVMEDIEHVHENSSLCRFSSNAVYPVTINAETHTPPQVLRVRGSFTPMVSILRLGISSEHEREHFVSGLQSSLQINLNMTKVNQMKQFQSVRVLKRGWVLLKRGRFKTWRKRYLVLLSSKEILFMKSEDRGCAKRVVDISGLDECDLFLESTNGASSDPHANVFVLKGRKLSWKIMTMDHEDQPPSEDTAKAWYDAILDCVGSDSSSEDEKFQYGEDEDDDFTNSSSDSLPDIARHPDSSASDIVVSTSSPHTSKRKQYKRYMSTGHNLRFDDVPLYGMNTWQKLSGNTPVQSLSLSPYSAQVLAAKLLKPES